MAFSKTCHYCLTFHADFLRASSHVHSCSKEQLTFTSVLFIYISAKYRLVIQGRRRGGEGGSISYLWQTVKLHPVLQLGRQPRKQLRERYTCILQKYFHLTLSLLISSRRPRPYQASLCLHLLPYLHTKLIKLLR